MTDHLLSLSAEPQDSRLIAQVPTANVIQGLDTGDVLFGTENDDIIFGYKGSDLLEGLQGNDTLYGGRGADLLDGGAGDDLLLGQRGNDLIFGGSGNDSLVGGQGDDILFGEEGTDTLTGGPGFDVFVLDSRYGASDPELADVITDFSAPGGDLWSITDGVDDTVTLADLTLETVANDTWVRLNTTGEILGRFLGVSAEELPGTFSTVEAIIDNTEVGANVLEGIPGIASWQGEVGDTDPIDMFEFDLQETAIVTIQLTGLSADADLALYQDQDQDRELGLDDLIALSIRGGSASEIVENITLKPGKYFITVESFEGNTPYTLEVSGVPGTIAPDLAGDTPSTARVLSPQDPITLFDYVGGEDPLDTYVISTNSAGYLDVFTDYRDADVNLTLWADTNLNGQFDPAEVISQEINEIILNNLEAGTYYVNVTALGAPTPYQIGVDASAGSRVGIEAHQPLFPGLTLTGTLSFTDAFDPNDGDNYADPYLLPELAEGATVTITQESEDFDAYLTVVNLFTGEIVAENDDIDIDNENFNAQVSFTTEPGGQYVVYASSVDSPGIGKYTLNATVENNRTASIDQGEGAGQFSLDIGERFSAQSASINLINPLLPPPVFSQNTRTDTGDSAQIFNFAYEPLTGGEIAPIRINNVNQGGFGDCVFIAALAATFGKIEDPRMANTAISNILNGAITSDGLNYTVRFYDYQTGQPAEVILDNQVPIYQGSLFGARWESNQVLTAGNASGQPIWASLFERAYAGFRGEQSNQNGYDVIGNGDFEAAGLRRVTGQTLESILFPNSGIVEDGYGVIQRDENDNFMLLEEVTPEQVFQRIQNTLDLGGYAISGTIDGVDKMTGNLLVPTHAYSIHNAYLNEQGERMILVRNPWGLDREDQEPADDLNDGFVAITFETFLQNFDNVSLARP